MSRTLVVYHSRSGHTRGVARRIAEALGADVDEIRVVQRLGGAIGYAFCAIEAIAGLTPALRPPRNDPARYDCVVVGTPVWFWGLSSPVRSWLAQHGRACRRVAFFCTMGSSGAGRAFAAMASLAGNEPIATLALTDREIDSGAAARLDGFVQAVKAGGRAHARRKGRTGTAAGRARRTSSAAVRSHVDGRPHGRTR